MVEGLQIGKGAEGVNGARSADMPAATVMPSAVHMNGQMRDMKVTRILNKGTGSRNSSQEELTGRGKSGIQVHKL